MEEEEEEVEDMALSAGLEQDHHATLAKQRKRLRTL